MYRFHSCEKGDEIEITTTITKYYPYLMVYDKSKVNTRFFRSTGSVESSLDTYSYTAEQDGYIRSQHDEFPVSGIGILINKGQLEYITPSNIDDFNLMKEVNIRQITAFSPGGYNIVGTEETSEVNMARTEFIKYPAGTIINIVSPSPYQYMPLVSDVASLPTKTYFGWMASTEGYTFAVTAEHPYVAFAVRNHINTTETMDIAEMLKNVKLTHETRVVHDVDLTKANGELLTEITVIDKKRENQAASNHESSFRTPSLAQGGTITIIDDDGHNDVYDGLYPFLKGLGVPFGSAIVPKYVETNPAYMDWGKLEKLLTDKEFFEVMNHSYDHLNLSGLTPTAVHDQVYRAVKWLVAHGIDPKGFVLPYGGDNPSVLRIVQHYHNSCYDFNNVDVPETFATINNYSIQRSSFGIESNRIAKHKTLVDRAVANNGWLVITTHVGLSGYWDDSSYEDLETLINYAKSAGCKFVLPKDGFQIFGNLMENDSGFKIQANGKIVGSQ